MVWPEVICCVCVTNGVGETGNRTLVSRLPVYYGNLLHQLTPPLQKRPSLPHINVLASAWKLVWLCIVIHWGHLITIHFMLTDILKLFLEDSVIQKAPHNLSWNTLPSLSVPTSLIVLCHQGVNCNECLPYHYRPATTTQFEANPCLRCECNGPGVRLNEQSGLLGDCVMNNDGVLPVGVVSAYHTTYQCLTKSVFTQLLHVSP